MNTVSSSLGSVIEYWRSVNSGVQNAIRMMMPVSDMKPRDNQAVLSSLVITGDCATTFSTISGADFHRPVEEGMKTTKLEVILPTMEQITPVGSGPVLLAEDDDAVEIVFISSPDDETLSNANPKDEMMAENKNSEGQHEEKEALRKKNKIKKKKDKWRSVVKSAHYNRNWAGSSRRPTKQQHSGDFQDIAETRGLKSSLQINSDIDSRTGEEDKVDVSVQFSEPSQKVRSQRSISNTPLCHKTIDVNFDGAQEIEKRHERLPFTYTLGNLRAIETKETENYHNTGNYTKNSSRSSVFPAAESMMESLAAGMSSIFGNSETSVESFDIGNRGHHETVVEFPSKSKTVDHERVLQVDCAQMATVVEECDKSNVSSISAPTMCKTVSASTTVGQDEIVEQNCDNVEMVLVPLSPGKKCSDDERFDTSRMNTKATLGSLLGHKKKGGNVNAACCQKERHIQDSATSQHHVECAKTESSSLNVKTKHRNKSFFGRGVGKFRRKRASKMAPNLSAEEK